jgi:hypothetical protein
VVVFAVAGRVVVAAAAAAAEKHTGEIVHQCKDTLIGTVAKESLLIWISMSRYQ